MGGAREGGRFAQLAVQGDGPLIEQNGNPKSFPQRGLESPAGFEGLWKVEITGRVGLREVR